MDTYAKRLDLAYLANDFCKHYRDEEEQKDPAI